MALYNMTPVMSRNVQNFKMCFKTYFSTKIVLKNQSVAMDKPQS